MGKASEEIMKRAVIAGASRALRFKEEHPADSEQDVLKQVMRDLRSIINEIDRE
jgi:hypothetical protein